MKGRFVSFDALRFLAIILVVLQHAVYNYSGEVQSSGVVLGLYMSAKIGLVLFIMLSGCLLLDRDYTTTESIKKHYFVRMKNMFITFSLWVLIWEFFNVWFAHRSLSIGLLIKDLFWIQTTNSVPAPLNSTQVGWNYLWYMPLILFLYLILPYLSVSLRELPHLASRMLITGLLVVGSILPTVNSLRWWDGKAGIELNQWLSIDKFGVWAVAVFVLGSVIKRDILKKYNLLFLWGVAIVIQTLAVVWTNYLIDLHHRMFDFRFSSVNTLVLSVVVFETFRRIKIQSEFWTKCFMQLSKLAFGVYVLHRPIQFLLTRYVFEGQKSLGVAMLQFVIPLGVSVLLVYLLNKVDIVKKWLFMN